MRIITIGNRKGGTGKTTTCYNLAFSLALINKRVLLIDLDSQANLTLICDMEPISLDEFKRCSITSLNDKIDILPATKDFPVLLNEMSNMINRNTYLKSLLSSINDYDYILIDTSPSFNILNVNAYFISDTVLIVINPDYFSIAGLSEMQDILSEIKETNTKLEYHIVLNGYSKNRKYLQDLIPVLQKQENYSGIQIPHRQHFVDMSAIKRPAVELPEIQAEYNKIMAVIS